MIGMMLTAFFTMGKAMFNGMIPYLDLFEQKCAVPIFYLWYCFVHIKNIFHRCIYN